jgi:hypothetical protein
MEEMKAIHTTNFTVCNTLKVTKNVKLLLQQPSCYTMFLQQHTFTAYWLQ